MKLATFTNIAGILLSASSTLGFFLMMESEDASIDYKTITTDVGEKYYGDFPLVGGSYKELGSPVDISLSDGVLYNLTGAHISNFTYAESYFDYAFRFSYDDPALEGFSITDDEYLAFNGNTDLKACNGFTLSKYVYFLTDNLECTVYSDVKLKVFGN